MNLNIFKQWRGAMARTKIATVRKKSKVSTRGRARAMNSQDTTDLVQRKAYELFESRGAVHGSDVNDWFEAEKIVRAQSN